MSKGYFTEKIVDDLLVRVGKRWDNSGDDRKSHNSFGVHIDGS